MDPTKISFNESQKITDEFEKAVDELDEVLDKIDPKKIPSLEEQLGLIKY